MGKRSEGGTLVSAKRKLAENPGTMFERIISEDQVNEECTFLRHVWRKRVFTPLVTLWTFLGQVLSADPSCRNAVARVLSFLSVTKGLDASHDPSAYGVARKRLPGELLPRLTRMVAAKLELTWSAKKSGPICSPTTSLAPSCGTQRSIATWPRCG